MMIFLSVTYTYRTYVSQHDLHTHQCSLYYTYVQYQLNCHFDEYECPGENTFLTIGIRRTQTRPDTPETAQSPLCEVLITTTYIVARIHSVESTCTFVDAATSGDFGWFFRHCVLYEGGEEYLRVSRNVCTYVHILRRV